MKISNMHKFLCGLFLIFFLSIIIFFGSLWLQAYKEHIIFKKQENKLQQKLLTLQNEKNMKEDYINKIDNDEEFVEWVAKQRLGYATDNEIVFKFNKEHEGL